MSEADKIRLASKLKLKEEAVEYFKDKYRFWKSRATEKNQRKAELEKENKELKDKNFILERKLKREQGEVQTFSEWILTLFRNRLK